MRRVLVIGMLGAGLTLTGSSTATPNERASSAFKAARTWQLTSVTPGDYRWKTTISIGRISRIGRAPLIPGFSRPLAPRGCRIPINPQTDAVIPARITVENQTRGFDAPWRVKMGSEPAAFVYAAYATGQVCAAEFWEPAWGRLRPGGRAAGYAYYIIRGFYSPRYPSGNRKTLRGFYLEVQVPAFRNAVKGPGYYEDTYWILLPYTGRKCDIRLYARPLPDC